MGVIPLEVSYYPIHNLHKTSEKKMVCGIDLVMHLMQNVSQALLILLWIIRYPTASPQIDTK